MSKTKQQTGTRNALDIIDSFVRRVAKSSNPAGTAYKIISREVKAHAARARGRNNDLGFIEQLGRQADADERTIDNLDEQETMKILLDGLKSKGKKYADFRRFLQGYINCAEKSEKDSCCLSLRAARSAYLLGLELVSGIRSGLKDDKLVQATRGYLAAKYPSDFPDTSRLVRHPYLGWRGGKK